MVHVRVYCHLRKQTVTASAINNNAAAGNSQRKFTRV